MIQRHFDKSPWDARIADPTTQAILPVFTRLTWIKAFAASRTAPLRQHPRLNAGMTGPVGGMYMARETAVSQRNETAVFVKQDQRKAVPHGRFSGFHDSIHRKQLVFDTNRE